MNDLERDLSQLLLLACEHRIAPSGLYRELSRLSTGHTRQGWIASPRQLDVHRTRVLSNEVSPKSVKELSYPPLKYTKLGRANAVGERVFYGSLGVSTTLAETRTDSGESVVTSRWTNTRKFALQRIGLDDPNHPLERFYRRLFCEPGEGLYSYSAEIARQFCTGNIAGLVYPSMIAGDLSVNVALKKEAVDLGLRFVEATRFYVEEGKPGTEYKYAQTDYARSEGRKLLWRGHGRQWSLRKQGEALQMKWNGIEWIATDMAGRKVLPD